MLIRRNYSQDPRFDLAILSGPISGAFKKISDANRAKTKKFSTESLRSLFYQKMPEFGQVPEIAKDGLLTNSNRLAIKWGRLLGIFGRFFSFPQNEESLF